MNFEQLKYIIEVAKLNSISAASQNLHVTLPTISQSITQLESEFGVKLFTRSRNGTIPTPEGRALIQSMSEIVGKINKLKEEAQNYSSTINGVLRIATIPGPMSVLVKTIAQFKSEFPNVKIELSEKGSQEILDDIKQGNIELGFIVLYEDLKPRVNDLAFVNLAETKVACCVSNRSALAKHETFKTDHFKSSRVVLYKEEYVQWFANQIENQFGPIDIMFTTNNSEAIIQAMKEELVVTFVLDYFYKGSNSILKSDFKLLDIDIPNNKPVQFGWVHHRNNSSSKIIENFIKRLEMNFTNRLQMQLLD